MRFTLFCSIPSRSMPPRPMMESWTSSR